MGLFKDHRDTQRYSFSLMLPDNEFQIFSSMSMRHLGSDLGYSFSFDYPDPENLEARKQFMRRPEYHH